MLKQQMREFAIFHKIGCHGNVPWEKEVQIDYRHPKKLSFGEKIVKIGPVDPEIIVLRAIIKKDEKKINATKITLFDRYFWFCS